MLPSLYKVWLFYLIVIKIVLRATHKELLGEDSRSKTRGKLNKISVCSLSSVAEIFPPVTFNFAGGASMFVRPIDYLVHSGFVVSIPLICTF